MAGNSNGWVKIHRKLMDNPGYLSEPFCRNMAWIDLILLANFKPGFYRVRSIRVDVQRGQVGYAVESLADRWGWSRGKVERFIKELENDGQIVRQKNNVTTLFTIVNYELYNGDGNPNDNADDNADGHQTVKQTDTREESKEVKKVKKVKKKPAVPASPLLVEFCHEGEVFKNTYLKFLEMLRLKKKPATEPTVIQQMLFLKNFDEETAIGIIEYSLNGGYPGLYEPKKNGKEKSNSNETNTERSVKALLSGTQE